MTTCVDPVARFFDNTDAIHWAGLSRSSARPRRSKYHRRDQAERTALPHAMHPLPCKTTCCIEWYVQVYVVKVSTVSAVPAGEEVIARDDVFGMVGPEAT